MTTQALKQIQLFRQCLTTPADRLTGREKKHILAAVESM